MFYQLILCKVIAGQLYLAQRSVNPVSSMVIFIKVTEEPIAVLNMAASIPRNKPRTPSTLKMVDSASKEFL